jgi:hypothetical protein
VSYRHIRQPLNRTIHRDLALLAMFDNGVLVKNIPKLVPAVSQCIVYQAIERRKRFQVLYATFHREHSYETLRSETIEKQESNGLD